MKKRVPIVDEAVEPAGGGEDRKPRGLVKLAPGEHLWFVDGKCYLIKDPK